MELKDCVNQRFSYRGEFTAEPVSKEELKYLLELAYKAPTGCNLQTPQFIAINEPSLVFKLAEIYGSAWAKSSRAAVVIAADPNCKREGSDVSYYREDFGAAAEQLLLACTELGLATVWIQGQIVGEKAAEMAKLLGLPQNYQVVGYFPLGRAAKTAHPPKKQSFDERCFLNQYGQKFR